MNETEIRNTVISTLKDFIQDWGLDAEISSETTIVGDLEFDSIDVIQFTVELEKAFGSRKIGFQDLLMQDGRYVDDLSIAQFQNFLVGRLVTA
jgi:acyl carrier protein